MKKIVVTSHIPEDLYEEIRTQAFAERTSIAKLIRNACIKYLELKVQENNIELNTGNNS